MAVLPFILFRMLRLMEVGLLEVPKDQPSLAMTVDFRLGKEVFLKVQLVLSVALDVILGEEVHVHPPWRPVIQC